MYTQSNNVEPSHNHFCNGNATMCYPCVAELHVTVNYIKMLSVA